MKFMKIFFKIVSCFLLGIFLLVGCHSEKSDERLKDKIETALTGYKMIDIDVKNGVVTLSGTVSSESEKDKLEGIAKAAATTDFKSIQNDLIVVSSRDIIAPAQDMISEAVDSTLTRDVNRVLESFPSITAEVKNGTIKASGNLEEHRMNELKAAFDNLKPKAVDMSGVLSK